MSAAHLRSPEEIKALIAEQGKYTAPCNILMDVLHDVLCQMPVELPIEELPKLDSLTDLKTWANVLRELDGLYCNGYDRGYEAGREDY